VTRWVDWRMWRVSPSQPSSCDRARRPGPGGTPASDVVWDFGLMTRQRSQASKNGLGLIWGLIGLADLVVRALSWGSGHYYELSVLSTGQSRITVDPQCFVVCCVHHLAVVQCWIFSALKYLKISWKSYSGDGGPWLLVPLPLAVPL